MTLFRLALRGTGLIGCVQTPPTEPLDVEEAAPPLRIADLWDGAVDQGTVYETTQMVGIVRARVGEAMNRFDERERLIVQERLLGRDQKKTLSDLGRELGLSRERVRQIEQRVKQKLRRSLADLADDAHAPMAA